MNYNIDKAVLWQVKSPERLVQAVRSKFEVSAAKAKTLIERGHFRINRLETTKPGIMLNIGDTLEYDPRGPSSAGPFGVGKVFLDNHVVVVNKPAGLLSAPLEGSKEANALGAARRFCQQSGKGPKVVHRLDKATSGLLAFGRGQESTRHLAEQLVERTMTRTYFAVVDGTLKQREGLVTSRLVANTGKNRRGSLPGSLEVKGYEAKARPSEGHGKWSATRYRVHWTKDGLSGIEVNLITGRTHQIRIHMAELGAPVCGESVYGRTRPFVRLALHAGRLNFIHPNTQQSHAFTAEWPDDLQGVCPWSLFDTGGR